MATDNVYNLIILDESGSMSSIKDSTISGFDVEKVAASISITNTMNYMANDTAVHNMFMKERESRVRYSKKIHDKENPSENFYDENVSKHEFLP